MNKVVKDNIAVVGGGAFASKLAATLISVLNLSGLSRFITDRPTKQMQERNLDREVNERVLLVRRGGTITGPVFLPGRDEEWMHGSRQVRRYALRTLSFAQVTANFPLESRRHRRALARARAVRLYRQAMAELNPAQTPLVSVVS